jgi:hypothetical protein
VSETRKALAGWDLRTLDEAADRLAKTCKFFPKPAEVIEVCEAIASSRGQYSAPPSNPDWTADAFKAANRLVHSDMGRQAAREGWIGTLHDFCRINRRMPNGHEISHLKKEAKLFDEAYSQCCTGNGGTLGEALKKLGETFLERRNKLAAMAHGEKHGPLTDRSRAMMGDTE